VEGRGEPATPQTDYEAKDSTSFGSGRRRIPRGKAIFVFELNDRGGARISCHGRDLDELAYQLQCLADVAYNWRDLLPKMVGAVDYREDADQEDDDSMIVPLFPRRRR
jgi:hypothetical protein